MTCKEVQDVLLEHRAGELPTRVRVAVALHAGLCSCCRALIRTYGILADLSSDLAAAPLPSDVSWDVDAFLHNIDTGKFDPV